MLPTTCKRQHIGAVMYWLVPLAVGVVEATSRRGGGVDRERRLTLHNNGSICVLKGMPVICIQLGSSSKTGSRTCG